MRVREREREREKYVVTNSILYERKGERYFLNVDVYREKNSRVFFAKGVSLQKYISKFTIFFFSQGCFHLQYIFLNIFQTTINYMILVFYMVVMLIQNFSKIKMYMKTFFFFAQNMYNIGLP
jgi:hypothetical protein